MEKEHHFSWKNLSITGHFLKIIHNCSQRDVRQRVDRGLMQMVLTPSDLFSWNKRYIKFNSIIHIIYINYMVLVFGKNSSLCLRWSFFIMPDLPVPPRPCPCCPCPCWALTAYFPRFLGGQPSLTPLPQADPISLRTQARPAPMSGTIIPVYISLFYIILNTSSYIFLLINFC